MTCPTPSFSIVIPTYKRIDSLLSCLDCLSPYFSSEPGHSPECSLEVIVSDDNCDPSIKVLLAHRYSWCRYVPGPSLGPAHNRNHGARQALGDWLVFTDDDCLPQPGWIEAYASCADCTDVMEGRTSPSDIRTRVDEECPVNETGGYLWSCNFAIRRHHFLDMGGFNESFPAPAMEDVEFNVRVNNLGLSRAFVPSALVLHPWRLRKGLSFLNAYAASVTRFVDLHPEFFAQFQPAVQGVNLLRSFKSDLALAIKLRTIRGLCRQLVLDLYSAYAVLRALRRIPRRL